MSTLVFFGPVAAVILLTMFAVAFGVAIELVRRSGGAWGVPSLAFLVVSLIYSLSSGRLTRGLSIWIAAGLVFGTWRAYQASRYDGRPCPLPADF